MEIEVREQVYVTDKVQIAYTVFENIYSKL